jgi:hypothetical protein
MAMAARSGRKEIEMNLYEQFNALFDAYPLAIEPVTLDGTQDRMVIADPGRVFHILHRVHSGIPHPFISLCPWKNDGDAVVADSAGGIEVQGAGVSGDPMHLVAASVPLPRDGSLLGWEEGGDITAIFPFYADEDQDDMPTWSGMPRADVPEAQWPPLTRQDFADSRLWDHYQAGHVADLGPGIGRTSRAVFWAATNSSLGSGCAVVTRRITGHGEWRMEPGTYAHWTILEDPTRRACLEDAIRQAERTDLAGRFAHRTAA